MKELLSIGTFSRMSLLSVKALRLYDEQGLLQPAYVDPATNYRYYAPEQASVARAIAILRSLDMPLAEIKDIVTESDPAKVRSRLDAHRAVLEERIGRDRQMLQRVENFIRKGAVMTYDMKIKDIESVDVVGVTLVTSPEAIGADADEAYARIYGALAQEGITPSGPERLVYHQMEEDAWTIEPCVPVENASQAPERLTLRRFEGGRAATALHVGPYDELGMAYRELENWIDEQGLESAGMPYDVYLNDPTIREIRSGQTLADVVKDPARFETEIVWPVR